MYVPVPVTLMGLGGGGLQSVLETAVPAAPPVVVVPAAPATPPAPPAAPALPPAAPAPPAVICPAAPAVVCPAAPAVVCPAEPDALSPAAPALVLPAEPVAPAAPAGFAPALPDTCPGTGLFEHATRNEPGRNPRNDKVTAVTRRQRSSDMSPPAQDTETGGTPKRLEGVSARLDRPRTKPVAPRTSPVHRAAARQGSRQGASAPEVRYRGAHMGRTRPLVGLLLAFLFTFLGTGSDDQASAAGKGRICFVRGNEPESMKLPPVRLLGELAGHSKKIVELKVADKACVSVPFGK